MNFNRKLLEIIKQKNSLLCVGLDTVLERLPAQIRSADDPFFAFNKAIIDATIEYAAAYKLNTAFYEAYGTKGWQALQKTLRYIPVDTIKIADAKRGDIGNTARMYARAIFDQLNADAVTVNPYMGGDSVGPFLENPEKGVFLLCLTSNPGSRDFQYFSDGKQMLYERVAELIVQWNENQNCGLVAGATHPEELAGLRKIAPDIPFLIPGIGAQGGDLEKSVLHGTDVHGNNALFNSSRAILYASSGDDFAEAARRKAEETYKSLNAARELKIIGEL